MGSIWFICVCVCVCVYILKFYFLMIFLIFATLHNIFLPSILFNKFYVFISFYYKLILINKFIKHNRVNVSCCAIKYLDLYLSLDFCTFVFIYHHFFFYLIILTSLSRTHDRHVILTYLMSRSRISRVNLAFFIIIFFSYFFFVIVASSFIILLN